MKPLIVLLLAFAIAVLLSKLLRKNYNVQPSARVALSVMLVFTAIGHFKYTEGMTMMLPEFIPGRRIIIIATGIFEAAAAVALWIPRLTKPVGWLLIAFLICVLPANIYAALHHVDYQAGNYDGPGIEYLWFRVPLQVLLIGWTYFCAIKERPSTT